MSLQFRGSTLSDENDLGYDFEIRAIGPDGRILTAYPWNSSGILSTTTLQFLTTEHLSAEQIVRWEYRLRPYQHCITFQNISLEPEQNSTPALSVKSLPASSESSSSRLELLNPDGTRWQGIIVEAQQGYTAPNPAAWSSWSGSNQNIDLSQLPAGQHLLLTRFPPSVMRLTTPLTALPDQTLHRVPLRRGLLPRQHSSSNYSADCQ